MCALLTAAMPCRGKENQAGIHGFAHLTGISLMERQYQPLSGLQDDHKENICSAGLANASFSLRP